MEHVKELGEDEEEFDHNILEEDQSTDGFSEANLI